MKLYCPEGHVEITVDDDTPVGANIVCSTCKTPLVMLRPFESPRLIDVSVLKLEPGQVLFVGIEPGNFTAEAAKMTRLYVEDALAFAGVTGVSVIVGPNTVRFAALDAREAAEASADAP